MKNRTPFALVLSILALITVASGGYLSAAAPKQPAPRDLLTVTTTLVLRRGLDGYNGVSDAYLKESDPNTAYGQVDAPGLQIKELTGGSLRTLLRFDLTQIPADATISEAWLELYVTYRSSANSAGVALHTMNAGWDETTATWNSAGNAYDPTPFGSGALTASSAYNRLDVKKAVQGWVQHPEGNAGLMVKGTSTILVQISSSDASAIDRRPRLTITYTSQGTPAATSTPTLTPTGTALPGPLPTPANTIYSYGPAEAFAWTDADYARSCIKSVPAGEKAELLLVWQGAPTSASLTFRYANNNTLRHGVLVNGHQIGILPATPNWSEKCSGGTLATLPFDPDILVNGVNEISILNDDVPGDSNGWSLQDPRIALGGDVQGPAITTASVPSTWDARYPQRATIQQPIGYNPSTATPLVIGLHGWGGRDYDALLWLAKACNDRGWLLACSDTRDGSEHTPSAAVQHDVIDLIDYMTRGYNVDPSRVYIVGSSMGGMMAATIAAKYPDRFAALVELKGPTRLDTWYYDVEAWRQNVLYSELNGTPANNLFAYQSRSAGYMAQNLSNVPTAIIHGRTDTLVDFDKHAQYLYDQMTRYGNEPLLVEYPGGHYDDPPDWDASRVMRFFSDYTLVTCPTHVTVRSPEPKSYYWLGISYSRENNWTHVDATLNRDTQTITLDVQDEHTLPLPIDLTLDLARMGLPTGVNYTVEDTDLDTGEYAQKQVMASTTSLKISIQSPRHHIVAYPFVAPTPQALTLQQGLADTFIYYADAPDTTHGHDPSLWVANSGNKTPLLRFDLTSIPAGVVVKAAQLDLYAASKWHTSDKISTSLHQVLVDWDANQATWTNRRAGEAWGAPGAQGATDYDPVALASKGLDSTKVWYNYNVTELLKRWLADPASNYGVLLRGRDGMGTFVLGAAEAQPETNRPKLVVAYTFPTITPTPSNTPTATATFTASPTSTPGPTFTPTASRTLQARAYLPLVSK